MSRPLALLVLPLLFAAPALAAGTSVLVDAEGDEVLLLTRRVGPATLPECSSRAADIRTLEVTSDEDTLRIALTVASRADPRAECGPVTHASPAGHFEGRLIEPYPEEISLAWVHEVGFRAGYGPEGQTHCVELWSPDSARSIGCLGAFVAEGDTLVWTLPIHGRAVMLVPEDPLGLLVHEEERAYDLRGLQMERRANTRIEIVDMWTGSFGTMHDSVSGGAVTL